MEGQFDAGMIYQFNYKLFFFYSYRYTASLKDPITALLDQLQAQAIAFNGYGVSKNPARWIGTEAGVAPDPNWSTGDGDGGGNPDSPVFNPAECDTTLQNSDRWFWVQINFI